MMNLQIKLLGEETSLQQAQEFISAYDIESDTIDDVMVVLIDGAFNAYIKNVEIWDIIESIYKDTYEAQMLSDILNTLEIEFV